MLDQVPNTNDEHRANVDRQGPKEQHRRENPTCQAKRKETVDASRKGHILGQQATPVAVLGNVPDIPPHSVIGPDDQVPEGIERGPIFLQCAHWINLWDLRKAMVLQMDCFEGMKIHQIERTEYMPHQNVGLGARKDIVMREFVDEAIKIQMENAQGHQKPRREARIPERQRECNGHEIQSKCAHQDGKFLAIFNPDMHSLLSSQGVL